MPRRGSNSNQRSVSDPFFSLIGLRIECFRIGKAVRANSREGAIEANQELQGVFTKHTERGLRP